MPILVEARPNARWSLDFYQAALIMTHAPTFGGRSS